MKDIEATRTLIDRAYAVAEHVFIVPMGRVADLIFKRMRSVSESDDEVIARLERAYAIASQSFPSPPKLW